jgi:hypothetical protein
LPPCPHWPSSRLLREPSAFASLLQVGFLCTQPPNQQRLHVAETPQYLERSAPRGDKGVRVLNGHV